VVNEIDDPDWPTGNYVRHPAWVQIYDSDGDSISAWRVRYANMAGTEADWVGIGGMLCGDTGTVQYSSTEDCWTENPDDAAYYYGGGGTACDVEPSPCPTVTIVGWFR
jgi:hypothetical protein